MPETTGGDPWTQARQTIEQDGILAWIRGVIGPGMLVAAIVSGILVALATAWATGRGS